MLRNGPKTPLPAVWGANDTEILRKPPLGPQALGAHICGGGAGGGLSAWPAQQQRAPLPVCISTLQRPDLPRGKLYHPRSVEIHVCNVATPCVLGEGRRRDPLHEAALGPQAATGPLACLQTSLLGGKEDRPPHPHLSPGLTLSQPCGHM